MKKTKTKTKKAKEGAQEVQEVDTGVAITANEASEKITLIVESCAKEGHRRFSKNEWFLLTNREEAKVLAKMVKNNTHIAKYRGSLFITHIEDSPGWVFISVVTRRSMLSREEVEERSLAIPRILKNRKNENTKPTDVVAEYRRISNPDNVIFLPSTGGVGRVKDLRESAGA